jgi:beta-lactamase regulating signal transducer with metallopeptidase domain
MHAVLNWLWQGCVVAVALAAMLGLLDRARANVRYLVCWAAQLFVLALPLLAFLEPAAGHRSALLRVPVGAVVSIPDVWWASGVAMIAAWLVWVAIGAVHFGSAMLAVRRARAHSQPFPAHVESALVHWRQVRDYGRRSRLVVSDAVGAAAVLGSGAPVIAVAPSLVARLEADELDRVIVHEWAHIQRRDDIVNLLQVAIRTVAGWHPAVWWIDRRLHAEREVACDETTVAITGAPKSYAACLVKLAELRDATVSPLAAPAVVAAWGLRARVTRIVTMKTFLAPRRSFGFAAVVAMTLAVVTVVAAQTRLVKPAGLDFPFDSLRATMFRFEGLAPVVPPAITSETSTNTRASVSRATPSVVQQEPLATDGTGNPVLSEPREFEPQEPGSPSTAVESIEPHDAVEASVDVPPSPVAAAGEPERSPWAAAADGGKSIGKKSKDAGLATAGVFSRFARRVAGSF